MRLLANVLALRTLLVAAIATLSAACLLDSVGSPLEGGNAGAGGGGDGAGGSGGEPACQTADDCGTPAECHELSCDAGACGDAPAQRGTACGDGVSAACDGDGNCLAADGETCATASDCASGFCADDVCCASACEGECNSCASDPLGTCESHAADEDPEDECGAGVCDGASNCANGDPVASGALGDIAAAFGVATYANGDVLIAGDFAGPLSFPDGASLADPGAPGTRDVFVARLASVGGHVWSRAFGASSNHVAFSAAIDEGQNAVIGGFTTGTIDFDDGVGLRTSQGSDAFVVKLDANGNTLWARKAGDGQEQAITGVGVDATGAVYVAGHFYGSINLGTTAATLLTSTGDSDVFVAKLSADGDHEWSKKFGDGAYQNVTGFAVNSVGRSALTGALNGDIDFGDAPLTSQGTDVYVAELDEAGAHVFSKGFGDAAAQLSHAVAIDEAGNVAVAGGYRGNMDLGGPPLPAADFEDIFLGVFDDGGTSLWSRGFTGFGDEIAWGVAFDGAGNVVLIGDITGEANFGGATLVAVGQTDVFAAKFSASGTELWSYIYGNVPPQHAEAIAIGPDDDVWLVGNFDGTMTFGGASHTSTGLADAFFARLQK